MKTIHPTLISLLLTILLTGVPHALLAETAGGAQGVVINGDTMTHDQNTDIIHASGAVHIEWQEMTLLAIEADYDRKSQVLTAKGNVVLIKGGDIVRGDKLVFDTVTGRGEIENGTMFIRQGNNFHLAGKKVTKTGEDDYEIDEGSFTTCDAATPAWKFGASHIDTTVEEYATGKNVIFYVKDVPVFYFPYMILPVKSERQSGLLFPHMGWSGSRGGELDLIYYWAISPSQEATFDLDAQTKRGVGTGLDYRYLRSRDSKGGFGGYLIYDLVDERWRGSVSQTHQEIFSPDMNLRMAVNAVSDRNFFSNFGVENGEYNRQSGDTIVNFLKTWDNYALTANLRYSQDYYATTNRNTLQTLPEVALAAVRQEVFSSPVYFDLDASAANFYRDTGTTGGRFNAFPRLTLVTGQAGFLNVSLFSGVHLRGYQSNIPTDSDMAEHMKETDGTVLPEAGARISTSFSRVYDVDGEHLKKLRHELVPEVSYDYTPQRDQDRLPFYDYNDRLVHQNIVYYSLTSLLGGKYQNGEVTEYRDISRIRLSQGYSVEGTRRDLLTLVDADHHWTDTILESDTWLHPKVRLTFDARYNVYNDYLSSAAPGLDFDDKQGNLAGVSYRMVRDQVDYLEGRLGTNLLKPLTLKYTTRYSFDLHNFLESVYSAEYRHQCWSVIMAWHERPGNNKAFTLNFNLAGLTGK